MIKILVVVAMCAFGEASHPARLKLSSPAAFRPGLLLPRPAHPPRLATVTRRSPFILYRNFPPYRYAMRHTNPVPTRNLFNPWKTSRVPVPAASEYSAPAPVIQPDAGAIHTIPAPNLSLSERPIVVIDSEPSAASVGTEAPKPTYEVTEKFADQSVYQPKIEQPIGFSKASTIELENIMNNNAALQIASQYGLPIHLGAQPVSQTSVIPQQFSMQGFQGTPQDFKTAEGLIMPPNGIYQQFPTMFQRFPPVEFLPFAQGFPPHVQVQQTQASETEAPLYLLQNEQITRHQAPTSFVPSEEKNIVQRETHLHPIISLVPQAFSVKNVSENVIDIDVTTASAPQSSTTDSVTTEAQTTTTAKKPEANTENQNAVYYAQIGQSVGNVIANGFYTALNDVRATMETAAEKIDSENTPKDIINITTTSAPTTTQRETKALFIQNQKMDKTNNVDEVNNLIASPFEKTAESVNVAYTLLRANEKQAKVNQDGEIFAGQLVEAKISEDQDFNKEKAIIANRPAIRMFSMTEKRVSEPIPQISVVKAKIPPKSKLMFDDKTGEPVLRVYASYVDNPVQKEAVTAKLASMKRKDVRKPDNFDWKTDSIKNLDQEETGHMDPMAQFGLKIRSRSDDYVLPIFEDYE